jgi:hypothetical protein
MGFSTQPYVPLRLSLFCTPSIGLCVDASTVAKADCEDAPGSPTSLFSALRSGQGASVNCQSVRPDIRISFAPPAPMVGTKLLRSAVDSDVDSCYPRTLGCCTI